jgi:small subunit ribosomal protein S8
VSASKTKERIVRILQKEGYLEAWTAQGEGVKRTLALTFRYRSDGSHALQGLERVSRPGRRVYCPAKEAPRVLNGLGISILSTSRGLLTDAAARRLGVGGEVLCKVW